MAGGSNPFSYPIAKIIINNLFKDFFVNCYSKNYIKKNFKKLNFIFKTINNPLNYCEEQPTNYNAEYHTEYYKNTKELLVYCKLKLTSLKKTINKPYVYFYFRGVRTNKFIYTFLIENIVNFQLTYRKHLPRSLKEYSYKSRFKIQSFFFFKYLKNLFFLKKLKKDFSNNTKIKIHELFFKKFIIYGYFLRINGIFLDNIKLFEDVISFFFTKQDLLKYKPFVFFFKTKLHSYGLKIFKRIKAIKKFRRKLMVRDDRQFIERILTYKNNTF